MEIKVISYEKGDIRHSVSVGEETALMRMRRSRIQAQQIGAFEAKDNSDAVKFDPDVWAMCVVLYPDCFGGVVDWGTFKNPPTAEEFMKLPGQFVDSWATAVWELNPHWKEDFGKSEEDVAKEEEDKLKKVRN